MMPFDGQDTALLRADAEGGAKRPDDDFIGFQSRLPRAERFTSRFFHPKIIILL
jgi:hypothetical protein